MIEAIAKRKSIRSFADKKVEAEKVESLLRAAMRAPAASSASPGSLRPGGFHRYAEIEPRWPGIADGTSGHRGAGKGDPLPH